MTFRFERAFLGRLAFLFRHDSSKLFEWSTQGLAFVGEERVRDAVILSIPPMIVNDASYDATYVGSSWMATKNLMVSLP